MSFSFLTGFKVKPCPYCGKNPVPHFLYWYFESSNIFFAPLRRWVLQSFVGRGLNKLAGRMDFSWHLLKLGQFLKMIKIQPEIERCKVPRAKALWQEAIKRGMTMQELLLFGRPFDVYMAEKSEIPASPAGRRNSKFETNPKSKILNLKSRIVFSGLPRPENYQDFSLDWMDDKRLFKKKLQDSGLPVPQGGSTWTFNQAKKIFDKIQAKSYKLKAINLPVIVKPRAGSRGRHSTTFVSSIAELKQAFKVAKQLCHWAVVEEQLSGPVYRATLINFELCGVLRGDPPQVVGDGFHNIRELVEIKNNQPHPGIKGIVLDEETERFLSRQFPIFNFQFLNKSQNSIFQFSKSVLDYTPAFGEIINLSEKVGVNYGGASSEDFEICHPENKALFVRAAKIVGDPIVGFDFIIPDIAKSWQEQKCGFIEANSLPFINLHHDPLRGKPRNVAVKVWGMVGF